MLKELFPYCQYGNTPHFRYYIFFVEECIMNEKYEGYTAGRCEVRVDEEQYSINEFRYLTNKKSFWKFRDLVECRHFNIIGLFIIKSILKYVYKRNIR
jgi:hypothetical protein